MKIDPKLPANGELQSSLVSGTAGTATPVQNQAKAATASQAQTEDTFQASGRHAEVQQLAAQAANVPDVRAAKIAPLQAKMQRGTYKPDSKKVADALLADQSTAAKG
jgi:negative regulator of flagellin synthesis FlgM